ncbi:hypothetical protein So717_22840 [Roseobacter cerasinus]|uniref:Uncharacterized protein n=1 Tax=Roseobacter cerasinus TaxID=2602289 RepID=A0A640VTW5_9RHOB|nr:hypothetical protein [Roseobacter cerasinus]GFE50531.1 hypothetical protein So717_22840 [Roseobacter cerasinus]
MINDDQLTAARESFSGKNMTETQLNKAIAIADIIHADIQKSGSFIEPLTDFSHAFARSEKFDAMRAEKMIRDVFTATRGQSMNQMRESLQTAADNLPDTARARALVCAESIGDLIQAAPTQPFYLAQDRAAVTLSSEFGITQNAAKALMADVFEQAHGKELYAHGKELEEAYHKPVREAEIAARKAEQLQSRNHTQSYS